jgi:hypothetical protein
MFHNRHQIALSLSLCQRLGEDLAARPESIRESLELILFVANLLFDRVANLLKHTQFLFVSVFCDPQSGIFSLLCRQFSVKDFKFCFCIAGWLAVRLNFL